MIRFSCPCGMKFKVKEDFAGRKTHCPTCKQPLTVPPIERTQAFVPQDQIDGTLSSIAQAGLEGGVTLDQPARTGQKPVQELLARRSKGKERYVLEGEIARGGMGAVLRAVDCDIRREVAVKYLLDQADAQKKLRFVEEAQITGQLEHPNIVPIHELGVDAQGRVFFTMKIIKGRSLAQILDDLRQNPKTAEKEYTLGRLLNIFVNICNPVAYAHSRGVVNRDLKPANVMVGEFGEVYVMDWGLAKVLKDGQGADAASPVGTQAHEFARLMGELPGASSSHPSKVKTSREPDADLTQDGAIMGTPVYMPPEQATGELRAIDQRSDIYSLGAILYEMLTLQAPIDKAGDYLAILLRVTEGRIQTPEIRTPQRARAGKIPRELSAIAMKALAKEPRDRYQAVEALRRDIELFQEGRSVSAKEDTFKEMAWKLIKRNKGASLATAAGLIGLAAVLAVSFRFINEARIKAESQQTRAEQAQARAEQALVAVEQEQKDKQERTQQAIPALVVAARQVANASNFPDAHRQVDLALLYDPSYADAHLLKGQLLLGQKNWTAARGELEQYLEKKPNDADAKRLLALCSTGKVNDAPAQFAVAQVLARQNVPGPAIPLLQEVAVERKKREPLLPVYQKQIEVNWKGLGGHLSLREDAQFELDLINRYNRRPLTNLEPLKGIPLSVLRLDWNPVSDLTPLKGMPLTSLTLVGCEQVRDLAPLQGMQLTSLNLSGCQAVRDLAPLQGMPLTALQLSGCNVLTDLNPLRGMPLTTLSLSYCYQVQDLSPLQGMPLTELNLHRCRKVQDLTPLQGMPLTELNLHDSNVQDLTPLKGLKLTRLTLGSSAHRVHDLTPLEGMSLIELNECNMRNNSMDVLRRMKSLTRINGLVPDEFWKKYDAEKPKK